MTDPARQALAELVTRHGRSLGDDTQRCEALLRDHLASHRRDVNLLVAALKARAVAELQRSSGTASWSVQAPRLMARLEDELGLAPDAARWAIESWGLALGLVSEAEIARAPQPAAGAARPHAGRPSAPPHGSATLDDPRASAGAPIATLAQPPGPSGVDSSAIAPTSASAGHLHGNGVRAGLIVGTIVGVENFVEWHLAHVARPDFAWLIECAAAGGLVVYVLRVMEGRTLPPALRNRHAPATMVANLIRFLMGTASWAAAGTSLKYLTLAVFKLSPVQELFGAMWFRFSWVVGWNLLLGCVVGAVVGLSLKVYHPHGRN